MSPRTTNTALVFLLLLAALRADARIVAGTVLDSTRRPLTNTTVRAWGPRDADTSSRPELATTTTAAGGRFRLDTGDRTTELLSLDGPDGTGRVRLDATSEAQLTIPYPVRTTIVLLHDNDLHFNFNHADRFAAEVARIRSENRNVYLLNAGDAFIRSRKSWNTPTKEYYAEQTRAIIDRMNALGYDAMTLGNHELDYVDDLTKAALGRATFPLLAANVDVTTARLPQPRPYTVLTTDNDLTVAVLGLSTVNFTKDGVAMRDAYQALNGHFDQISRRTVRVALTHVGLPVDQLLARTTSGIDVIIGGHCHTLLTEAVTANGTLIAQAGGTAADRPNPVDPSRPKYLGVITLTLENDRIVAKAGRVFTFAPEGL